MYLAKEYCTQESKWKRLQLQPNPQTIEETMLYDLSPNVSGGMTEKTRKFGSEGMIMLKIPIT